MFFPGVFVSRQCKELIATQPGTLILIKRICRMRFRSPTPRIFSIASSTPINKVVKPYSTPTRTRTMLAILSGAFSDGPAKILGVLKQARQCVTYIPHGSLIFYVIIVSRHSPLQQSRQSRPQPGSTTTRLLYAAPSGHLWRAGIWRQRHMELCCSSPRSASHDGAMDCSRSCIISSQPDPALQSHQSVKYLARHRMTGKADCGPLTVLNVSRIKCMLKI